MCLFSSDIDQYLAKDCLSRSLFPRCLTVCLSLVWGGKKGEEYYYVERQAAALYTSCGAFGLIWASADRLDTVLGLPIFSTGTP